MIKRFIKKLLTPIVQEVIKDIKDQEAKSSQSVKDAVQEVLISALNRANLHTS